MNVSIEKYLPKDKRIRMVILMAVDMIAVYFASFLGLFIRFDMNVNKIPDVYKRQNIDGSPYIKPFEEKCTLIPFGLRKDWEEKSDKYWLSLIHI